MPPICKRCEGEGLAYVDGVFGVCPCQPCYSADQAREAGPDPLSLDVAWRSIGELASEHLAAVASSDPAFLALSLADRQARVERNRAATLRPPLSDLAEQALAGVRPPVQGRRALARRASYRAGRDAVSAAFWRKYGREEDE